MNLVNLLCSISRLSYMQFSTRMTQICDLKTLIFIDTETTGLPSMENNTTRVTELSMVAVEADHIRLGVFPRVQNKLNFCFSPRKLISSGAEKITGLTNRLLEHQSSFSDKTVDIINGFLSHNLKPLCFVAHNGYGFDYPILQAEIQKTKNTLAHDVYCIDSLQLFKDIDSNEKSEDEVKSQDVTDSSVPIEFLDGYDDLLVAAMQSFEGEDAGGKMSKAQIRNETTPRKQIIGKCSEDYGSTSYSPKKTKLMDVKRKIYPTKNQSYKLTDVYKRLLKKPPKNMHQAEGDVLLLITCAATLGDTFVDWANKHAKKFSDIPPMRPGVRFGK